jgi:hypothetical protein
MQWLNKLDREALLSLLEQLDSPQFQALEECLLELKLVAVQELQDSQKWEEFLETRGGIKVLDRMLEIRADIRHRVGQIEQEMAYGYDDVNGYGSDE